MGRNRVLKKRIAALKLRGPEHKLKQHRELARENSGMAQIAHRQNEINNRKEQIERAEGRLERQWEQASHQSRTR
ncbi:MAG TPA: hypothetical protein VGZ29_06360 [Terriglobia bacterium]|nr:hypothetical protein [Terriglobia bacterium]